MTILFCLAWDKCLTDDELSGQLLESTIFEHLAGPLDDILELLQTTVHTFIL
jgi:hypothetical protein